MKVIKIGLDAEFMAYKGKKPVYPESKAGIIAGISSFGCDEFGHCLEARPKEAETASDLVTNTMKAMERLPERVKYIAENAHIMEKDDFITLIRKAGGKPLPGCKNIYGKEILDDCAAELKVRQEGKRLVFCGMHVHVSAVHQKKVDFEVGNNVFKTKDVEIPIKMPKKILVWLFDRCLFKPLSTDKDAHIGRYRSPVFYEHKGTLDNWFEYRSLGSTAFTPERLYLIFEIIKELIDKIDEYTLLALEANGGGFLEDTESKLYKLVKRLIKTKAPRSDLRKLWVPWK